MALIDDYFLTAALNLLEVCKIFGQISRNIFR